MSLTSEVSQWKYSIFLVNKNNIFFKNEIFKISDSYIPKKHEIAGITSSEEFVSFLKTPWGADTLNITGCFEKVNEQIWNNILIFKDQLYKR